MKRDPIERGNEGSWNGKHARFFPFSTNVRALMTLACNNRRDSMKKIKLESMVTTRVYRWLDSCKYEKESYPRSC